MADLLPLVSFFISSCVNIELSPVQSELLLIWHAYCKDHYKMSISSFVDQVNRINEITRGCFRKDLSSINSECTLECINIDKLVDLEELLKVKDDKESKETSFLMEIDQKSPLLLSAENFFRVLNKPVNPPLNELEILFTKPTARKELAASKMKVKWPKRPFAEVCRNNSHIHTLSNLFGNGGDQISKLRGKVSSTIYQCTLKNVHYLPIITNYTDILLGDCSYLDTCHRMKTCRYLHYYTLNVLQSDDVKNDNLSKKHYLECIANEYTLGDSLLEYKRAVLPPQWISCDVRQIPFLILGKFAVIISDPAWDIHMSLPYGTCKDVELLSLPMNELQDEGIILLWVTGRSIETGRKALTSWGYTISDEIIWVKLNQLRRTIVTGRTGHWLNHSKEHLLVGVKGGNLPWLNRLVDSSIVVSSTRETLRKPDEIYQIVERIVGRHARKLELFGRDHNIRPGWFTIGNQVLGVSIYEEEVRIKYEEYKKITDRKRRL